MSLAEELKSKRLTLGLSVKDLSDALGFENNGQKRLSDFEKGLDTLTESEIERYKQFAVNRPYLRHNEDPEFTFIDLFAGIGGIRIPFQELGGECVFSSEWDSYAQKTYRVNFGETPDGDITAISSDNIPDFDILLGGFPCQPFSQAGLHLGFEDTRGTLFFEIERIIRDKRPKAFLLENVKQLRGHDGGRTLQVIVNHLENLGYTVDYAILKAKDFGVPQNRERIYIVGFDSQYYDLDDLFHFDFPEPPMLPTKVGDILEEKVSDKYTISLKLYEGHIRRKIENKGKGNGFGFSLFTPDSPNTNTISARYYKDGSEALIFQGDNKLPRKLTPRECARLQGFPDDFIIPVSDCRAYKQFGNSVAVPVIRAIAERMLQTMEELENGQAQ